MKMAIIDANEQLGFDFVKVFDNKEHKAVHRSCVNIDATNFKLSEKILKTIQAEPAIRRVCLAIL